ncbi:lipoyl(octanoyl) transferase LipB [Kiritimatiellota bacterium B12222]|nr:lipoyl(octanoyl) transferase LipB [Kiritimatiellota bacterium B12222]
MTPSRFCIFDKPLPYPEAVSLQEELVKARLADEIPDTFLLLQHPPVITLGRRGRRSFLLASEEALAQEGISVFTSSRGGDVTYHGPGQWVLYPILKLSRNEMGAHGYLHALESVSLQTAIHFGIDAFRKEGKAGAWCAEGKFSAVGFKFSRWVTSHGLSLNVRPNLGAFDLIVGCGLVGERVASFKSVLGDQCPDMDRVAEVIREQIEHIFQRSLVDISEKQLLSPQI